MSQMFVDLKKSAVSSILDHRVMEVLYLIFEQINLSKQRRPRPNCYQGAVYTE